MLVERADNGELVYKYYRDSDERGKTGAVTLGRDQILHIPGLGFDGLIGYSPIAMARNAIGMALAVEDFGSNFFLNGANPGGILEHPGVVNDPERLRQSWQSQFSGAGAHKVAVLEEGLKFHQMSIAPDQAQFLETRKFQINEIARIFRVPPAMVGDLEGATYSNAEQMALNFVKYTLNPWVCRWEGSLQQCLLLQSEKPEIFIKFNIDGLLRGAYKERMDGYSIGIRNGIFSVNDVRSLENMELLPDEDGGNIHFVNGAAIKLQDIGAPYGINGGV